ncbi:hypothetical protein KMW28_24730 [Flammeovirga yaeyamensis]|uniref:Uncharacterized protein n=1 Tax=Flammeovirga yaeyamensis TaxID=367791 RepID=A0AAX1N9I4_9BACT|nr:hypothetical protein [Flammeovirga yaeyamensis]MBB3699505.1 hypothetical protein [Flammeovirga yaeyamensis]NMF35238.1 hypothetical protein [Flammeovirga yaeyamensis]QWG04099.1 hypothetical protein KMW28_24730 [Flammeovirga yaeyamensis]
MRKIIAILIGYFCGLHLQAQDLKPQKQRLDFARMYLEIGGNFFPSFAGKQMINAEVTSIDYSATLNPYITWGGFHFWGHAEFYVTFPIGQINLDGNKVRHKLQNSVATGARIYPWALKQGKIRPYFGCNWGTLAFEHIPQTGEKYTMLSKDFLLNFDTGMIYNYRKIGFRLAVNYYPNNKWQYPLNKTEMAEISTPSYSIQLGLLYAFDATKKNTQKNLEKWNSYPNVSKLSYDAKSFGDFFIGAGPSQSFSLSNSEYNAQEFPYLQQRLSSSAYFDLAVGYHFNQFNFFTALSFRNPTYTTEGFGVKQTIKKKSLAIELNKYLIDFSGFAPYIGLNIAYDNIQYKEDVNGSKRETNVSSFEPGITFGWDIVPGKTNEAIVLRTNLRWHPYANFKVDGKAFNFSQLEYNLIQVMFYPERLKR